MKKEELELEQEKMLEVINRLNIANKEQTNLICQLRSELNDAINRVKESYEKGSAKLATLPPGSTEAVELQQKLTNIDGLVARAEVLKGETIVHNMRVTLDNKEVFPPGSENERRGKEILSTTEANLESLKAKVRTNYGENSFNEIITP